ncbi:MAG: endopeptidase La [Candidatus Shikimatogenerans bostrichidophilus]|nr:MAG: endopeptidase La [Candidatus Shikimatogenerans bostrichidophilus]
MINYNNKIIIYKKKIKIIDKKKLKNYILIIKDFLIFPGIILPINIYDNEIKKIFLNIYKKNKFISVFIKKNNKNKLYKLGILCKIIKIYKINNNLTILLQGLSKSILLNKKRNKVYKNLLFISYIYTFKDYKIDNKKIKILSYIKILKDKSIQYLTNNNDSAHLINNINQINDFRTLIYYLLINIVNIVNYKFIIYKEINIKRQFRILLKYLLFELEKKKIYSEIINNINIRIKKQQIEYYLIQQIKALKEKIGYKDNNDIEILLNKSLKVKLSKECREIFNNEILKLKDLNTNVQEYYIIKNYLNLLLKLPWGKYTKDNIDINNAIKILNNNHYGIKDVKNRILEFLSILKLNNKIISPIICLIGPPGVGKTSLSKSIAKVLNRKFIRISLGGLHDESELRGNRKTYVGAMPGRIIKSIINVGTSNPVILLDEIDKIGGVGYNSDPSSALLEILDSETNYEFYDNYLEVGYDLSKILFITTANNINNINYILLDRMEIININGYTIEEKINISINFIIPKLIIKNGLSEYNIKINKKNLEFIIINYTNESGVRTLIKVIEKLLRYIARILVKENKIINYINKRLIMKILGSFYINKYEIINKPGISIGLAWTGYGGDIIYIESILLNNGQGRISITGNIGKVMKESIIIANKYIQANYKLLNIRKKFFTNYDLHVHIPEGAIPKDGPSAGIAIYSSLLSSYLLKPIKNYLAMTGEITLRGSILEVGGIKEKILAAKRLSIKNIILPYKNKYNIKNINKKYLRGIKFYYINSIEEIRNIIF